jgi:hypothetical protein
VSDAGLPVANERRRMEQPPKVIGPILVEDLKIAR